MPGPARRGNDAGGAYSRTSWTSEIPWTIPWTSEIREIREIKPIS
ncbi:hypothetical protein ACFT8W_13825 [Streptomyces hygroscopicus]